MIFNGFLKSKKLYMLFLLPFWVAVIALIGYYKGVEVRQFSISRGVISMDFLTGISPSVSRYVGYGMILIVAYLLFYLNGRYKFLPHLTTLPSVVYILLTAGWVLNRGFDPMQVSAFFSALGFIGLLGAINDTKSNRFIFDFGFWVSLAVLISPKLIILLLWAFCVLFFSGRSTLKDISAILLGWITPVFFTLFYYFWTDRLGEFAGTFRDDLLSGEYVFRLAGTVTVCYGILFVLLLISLYSIMVFYPISVVNQRRGILSFLSMLFFCGISLLVVPDLYPRIFYILFFPLAYIYSQYLLNQRLRWLGDVIFLLLLAVCTVFCFPDLF